jgi:hypothetical protein
VTSADQRAGYSAVPAVGYGTLGWNVVRVAIVAIAATQAWLDGSGRLPPESPIESCGVPGQLIKDTAAERKRLAI